MRKGGVLTYMLSDHLGSTSLMTNASGAVISETRYTAWGEVRYQAGTTSTGYTYTGQYSNTADFGLMYYNARWYDPALGRFAQADTIVPAGVQGYDRYAYVNNNPVRYTDPSGHCSREGDDWCYDSPVTPTPTPTATSTRTPIATSTPCSSPSNNCATQISAQVTYNAYNAYRCQNGAISCLEQIQPTSTPTPTSTPQPTSEFLQAAREEVNPIPSVFGIPSTRFDPAFSQAMVNSLIEIEIYLKLTIGVGITNAPKIADYLYGGQVVTQVVKGWLGFTNNITIIPPMPLFYYMDNPLIPSQYQYGPTQYQ